MTACQIKIAIVTHCILLFKGIYFALLRLDSFLLHQLPSRMHGPHKLRTTEAIDARHQGRGSKCQPSTDMYGLKFLLVKRTGGNPCRLRQSRLRRSRSHVHYGEVVSKTARRSQAPGAALTGSVCAKPPTFRRKSPTNNPKQLSPVASTRGRSERASDFPPSASFSMKSFRAFSKAPGQVLIFWL